MTGPSDVTADIADKVLQSNIEAHQLEAPIYDFIHPEIFGSFEQRRIERDLDLIASAMPKESVPWALDIGCGTGNLTLKLVKLGFHVRAVDVSSEMLERLRSKLGSFEADSVELVKSSAEDVLADSRTYGTWDVITFSSVLHHLPDYEAALLHALHQLRPGGILYVCHEPLQKSGTGGGLASIMLSRILDGLDNLYILTRKLVIYLIQSWKTGRFQGRTDYTLADLHSKSGIDARKNLGQLEAAGARVLLYETYRSRYSWLLASFDSRLGHPEHYHFRFIVQRKDRPVNG